MGIIANPAHPRFYGKDNDRMPAFGDDKLLTPEQIELVTDWLRGEWYEGESANRKGGSDDPTRRRSRDSTCGPDNGTDATGGHATGEYPTCGDAARDDARGGD